MPNLGGEGGVITFAVDAENVTDLAGVFAREGRFLRIEGGTLSVCFERILGMT